MSDLGLSLDYRKLKGALFKAIDVSASGDTGIVTVAAGEKLIVFSIFLIVTADVTVSWKSGTTTIIGAGGLKAGGGYHVESDFGVTMTSAGEAFVINLSSAVQVGGSISYAIIPA